jgi:hypothetical protein
LKLLSPIVEGSEQEGEKGSLEWRDGWLGHSRRKRKRKEKERKKKKGFSE